MKTFELSSTDADEMTQLHDAIAARIALLQERKEALQSLEHYMQAHNALAPVMNTLIAGNCIGGLEEKVATFEQAAEAAQSLHAKLANKLYLMTR